MIRIAQQGRAYNGIAERLEDVVGGIGVHWIEVNGERVMTAAQGLAAVGLRMADDEFNRTVITLHAIGPVEIVYLGPDGEPLGPGQEVTGMPDHFDHSTVTTP